MMRWAVLFIIRIKRIKNRIKYKNLCDSIIIKENIVYLLKWKNLKSVEETTRILKNMMMHELIEKWRYILYNYILLANISELF